MATIAIGISPKPGGGATADVPTNSLAEDGVAPEEGDKVSFSVEGTVKSVQGGNATIEIDSVNGEPVGEEAGESPEEEAGEEGEEAQQGQPPSGGGPPTSGASPRTGLDVPLAPMGRPLAAAPIARSPLATPIARSPLAAPPLAAAGLRNRLNRVGTDAMRQRLLKGARNRPLPF